MKNAHGRRSGTVRSCSATTGKIRVRAQRAGRQTLQSESRAALIGIGDIAPARIGEHVFRAGVPQLVMRRHFVEVRGFKEGLQIATLL